DILNAQDRWLDAAEAYQKALAIFPDNAEALTNLGNAWKQLGRLEDAAASYRRAIEIKPELAEVHSNLGTLLLAQDLAEDAAEGQRKAIAADPDYAVGHTNLGNALKSLKRMDEAAECHERAIALDPNLVEAFSNLSTVRQEQGRLEEAESACRKALALDPDYAEALCNLGSVLEQQDRLDEGEAACRRAIDLKPDYAQAHVNLSLFLFRQGLLQEAWSEYEWRWRMPEHARALPAFTMPRWDGSPLAGKSILLWAEQGIGDVVRYGTIIPDVAEAGANVTIACEDRMAAIFTRSFENANVMITPHVVGEEAMDAFDFHCPFGGLGPYFRASHDAFPTSMDGYLKAGPERVEFWKNRLSEKSSRPKVGLSWSSPMSDPLRDRYFASIEDLAPVLSIEDLDFVNLQSHDCREDIDLAKSFYGADIHTWDDLDLRNDIEGVAGLTKALDLVISFPTFGAEFAGALGVPVLCFCYNDNHIDFLGTGNAVWQPAIQYVTKALDEPWKEVMEDIGRIAREKFSL
ncbi:MAG: tetratricopeptide repeat protein, partial [Rhodospirillales bacterium]|nr:tetratricopeptide repeat protein [Rhodospirillales bacterium]